MFEVCFQHLIAFQSIPKNKAVRQSNYYRIPVYIYPAFHHLLNKHYFSNNAGNQGRAKYYVCTHQQFYIHQSFVSDIPALFGMDSLIIHACFP